MLIAHAIVIVHTASLDACHHKFSSWYCMADLTQQVIFFVDNLTPCGRTGFHFSRFGSRRKYGKNIFSTFMADFFPLLLLELLRVSNKNWLFIWTFFQEKKKWIRRYSFLKYYLIFVLERKLSQAYQFSSWNPISCLSFYPSEGFADNYFIERENPLENYSCLVLSEEKKKLLQNCSFLENWQRFFSFLFWSCKLRCTFCSRKYF